MDGKPAFPHGEDLGREAAVVVEIEGDVVEARADQAAEEAQLAGLEQVIRSSGSMPRRRASR